MFKSLYEVIPQVTSHAVGQKRVLLSKAEADCAITQIAITELKTGEIAASHAHTDMKEVFFVLSGDLDVTLDSNTRHCHQDDFIFVECGVAHELYAITDVKVMCIGCEILI